MTAALGLPVRTTTEKEMNVKIKDLMVEELRATGETSLALWLSQEDPHPNSRRHALIARALFGGLKTAKWADMP